MIAEVIINSSAKKLNRTFDYNIPKELENLIYIGSKVLVPFGNMKKLEEAHVISFKESSKFKIKDIAKVENGLTDRQIELANWMANRYFCNVSECIKLMQTPGTRTKNIDKRVHDKIINIVLLKKNFDEIVDDIDLGKIKSDKHKRILNFINDNEGCTVSEIETFTGCSRSIVNTLIKNQYLQIREKKIDRNPLSSKKIEKSENLKLTEEQNEAFERIEKSINKNIFEEFLLHGVTGSGKTEVYIQLINNVLEKGKRAIVLVPEISLTPQMLDRFISRFGKENIAVLHSKLSIGEKHDEWKKIKEGNVKIVIGARSAIFAPVEDLGIIIIDEEHDASYKSETTPKYNAKEIAKEIAKKAEIPLVLGSATPDLITYYKAKETGKIVLLELTKRANKSNFPEISIIDLKQELANGNRSMLSMELYKSIEENIKNKYQTILFLNRRGYSTFVMCRNCGYTVKCKNCDISMTYHSFENKMKCHYCGYEENMLDKCPECGSEKIRYFGTGTQKLEQEIHKQFPQAKTIRMDIDTVSKKNSHEEILNKFKNEDIDILIGTQMVVKGHHFPKVTLVGVIAADSSLNIDDYRATERTFQILTQVAGRAGRENIPGKVIIQSYNPENYSIQDAQKQNYKKFYETEITLREQLKYPPFCDIIVIAFNSIDENEIKIISNEVFTKLKSEIEENELKIFQPMPAPIDKMQNKYRWRIIAKGKMTKKLNNIFNKALKDIYQKNYKNTRITIDINPNNMM